MPSWSAAASIATTISSAPVRRIAIAAVRSVAGASGSASIAASRSAVCDALSLAVSSWLRTASLTSPPGVAAVSAVCSV
jgi:hypothetical protein